MTSTSPHLQNNDIVTKLQEEVIVVEEQKQEHPLSDDIHVTNTTNTTNTHERFIENGIPVKMLAMSNQSIPVDTPEDLDRVNKYLQDLRG